MPISDDVILGEGVRIVQPGLVNLYGCRIGNGTKIGAFVDHGPNLEDSDDTRRDYAAYQQVVAKERHIVVKPGDGLPLPTARIQLMPC